MLEYDASALGSVRIGLYTVFDGRCYGAEGRRVGCLGLQSSLAAKGLDPGQDDVDAPLEVTLGRTDPVRRHLQRTPQRGRSDAGGASNPARPKVPGAALQRQSLRQSEPVDVVDDDVAACAIRSPGRPDRSRAAYSCSDACNTGSPPA